MRFALGIVVAVVAAAPAQAQLSGTYTIGGASPDYAGIPAAVSDLESQGVSGNVKFLIRPGTYTPANGIDIGPIAGASAAARVRFEAEDPGNRPLLRRPSATTGSNFVVRLNGADWVTLENLNFEAAAAAPVGRLLVLEGVTSNVTVRGCVFTGHVAPTSNEGTLIWSDGTTAHDSFTLEASTLTGGFEGVRLTGPFPSYPTDVLIHGNTLTGQVQTGIFANIVGIIEANVVTDAAVSATDYQGIIAAGISDTVGPTIRGNTVRISFGGLGINGLAFTNLIANNRVSVASATGVAGIFSQGGLVAHNTVRAAGGAIAFQVHPGALGLVTLRNNVFIATGTGVALHDPFASSIEASDGNDLVAAGGTLVTWEGSSYATLANWQSASGFDERSVSITPTFVSTAAPADLHLAGSSLTDVALIGATIPEVPTDIDGDARDPYNAKMGADEGTPLSPLDNADAPAGFYTVAGASPDFATPELFFEALKARRMKGDVTAQIRAGTFPLRTSLREDVRVGPAAVIPVGAPLTLRGANPANRPVLTSSGATATTNWIIRLYEFDYIVLDHLEFDASGAGDYGRALVIADLPGTGGSKNVHITNCAFTGAASGVATSERSLVFVEQGQHDGFRVHSSTFNEGTYAVDFSLFADGEDIIFSNNTLQNQSEGGLTGEWSSVQILDNTFSMTASAAIALELRWGPGYTVLRNRILASGDFSIGLLLSSVTATSEAPGLVANNFITANVPLFVSGGDGGKIVHNTFFGSGNSGIPMVVSGNGGTINLFASNILYSASNNVVLSVTNSFINSVGNLYHTNGPSLLSYWWVSYATLEDFRSATGLEYESRVSDVTFVDPLSGDLHLAAAMDGLLKFAGIYTPVVTTDVDGESRYVETPYIGADELSHFIPLAGAYTVGTEVGRPTADFPTLAQALTHLDVLGLSSEVRFRLYADPAPLSGPHVIRPFEGATVANRLVFESYLGGAATIGYSPTGASDNATILIDDASHVSFRDLTIRSDGGVAPYGRAIVLSGDVGDVEIVQSAVIGRTGSVSPEAAVIFSESAWTTDFVIQSSQISNGSTGVLLTSDDESHGTGTSFVDVAFIGQAARGVALTNHDAPQFSNVTVSSTTSNVRGIELIGGTGASIDRARVSVPNTGGLSSFGLILTDQDGTSTAPVRIANTFVTAGTQALQATNVDYLRVVHSSLVARRADLSATVRSSGGSNQVFYNNLMVQSGGAAVFDVPDGNSTVSASDHNVIRTLGSNVANWGGSAYATLGAFQSGTGRDEGSTASAVFFVDESTGDLHLTGASDGDAALAAPPVADVNVDVDGAPRSSTFPYRGADEASTPLSVAVQLSIRALLQGAYQAGLPGGAFMRNDLALAGSIPLAQPYASATFDGTSVAYAGTESVPAEFFTTNPDFVDWVVVALRADPNGPDLARRALLLRSDRQIFDGAALTSSLNFPLFPGTYHVVVYHRNHLAVMSNGVSLSSSLSAVNLLSAANLSGGTAAAINVAPGTYAMAAGDGDASGSVLAPDRQSVWLPQVGQTGYLQGDFNLDGNVLADDRQTLWAPNVGRQSAVPGASLRESPGAVAER